MLKKNLITFKIDGSEYQAEEGMTWEEWVNSEYNTINAYEDGSGHYIEANHFLGMPLEGI
jgi:hypothetical protein